MALVVAGAAWAAANRRSHPQPIDDSWAGGVVAVRQGDTLRTIADRIGPADAPLRSKVDALESVNPDVDLLVPGQMLRDPWHARPVSREGHHGNRPATLP
jgi:hypothetical protein